MAAATAHLSFWQVFVSTPPPLSPPPHTTYLPPQPPAVLLFCLFPPDFAHFLIRNQYAVPNILHIINPQPCKMLLPPDQHYTVSPNYFTSQEQGEMQGVNFIPAACSLMERKECYASASFFHNRTEWRNRMIRTGRYLKHKTSQAFNSQRCKNCFWKYFSLNKWPGWVRYIVLK